MKALFYNVKGAGHVNPTLPLVRALIARGDEVFYTATSEWRGRLEALGAAYRNTGADADGAFTTADFHPGAPFYRQLLPTAVGVMPHLVEEARRIRPDVVIYDSCAPWGLAVATVIGCPAVCSVSTMILDDAQLGRRREDGRTDLDDENRAALTELATRWRVDLWACSIGFFYGEDNLVYSCEALQAGTTLPRERLHFVGPLLGSTDAAGELVAQGLASFAARADGRKRVYVSMGTVVAGIAPDFFAPFVQAFAGRADLEVLLSVGANLAASMRGLPAHVVARGSVPQPAVLAHSDVFVTHAGANSVHEGLFHGVPLVCVPRFGDQPENARRAVAAGAGLALPADALSAAGISSAVAQVLEDPSFAASAGRLGEQLRATGGLERAMRVLDGCARRGLPNESTVRHVHGNQKQEQR